MDITDYISSNFLKTKNVRLNDQGVAVEILRSSLLADASKTALWASYGVLEAIKEINLSATCMDGENKKNQIADRVEVT